MSSVSKNQTQSNTALHEKINQLTQTIKKESQLYNQLIHEVGNVLVGQTQLTHRMLIGLLANGHLLIEGVPGLAKTTAVASLARGIDTGFQRFAIHT